MSHSPQFELLNIGDIHIVNLNFMEQVAAVSTYQDSTTGETATRTMTREFATSTDGSTYTAFQTLNNANLAALVLDPDERLYFRLRFTRTGSDATGIIQYFRGAFDATIDPQAVSGHGTIKENTIEADLPELVKAMVENYIYQLNGGDHYRVVIGNPQESTSVVKPTIFLYNFDTSEIGNQNNTRYANRVQFNIHLTKVNDKTTGYPQMTATLRTMFQEYTFRKRRFTFEFKAVQFIDVLASEMGLFEPQVLSVAEAWDDVAKHAFKELIVSVKMRFSKSQNDLIQL